jgi:hypothetical protein
MSLFFKENPNKGPFRLSKLERLISYLIDSIDFFLNKYFEIIMK